MTVVAVAGLALSLAGCAASSRGGGAGGFVAPNPPPLENADQLETAGSPPAAPAAAPRPKARQSAAGDAAAPEALTALRRDLDALEAEFAGVRPGVSRLLDIENDIRALLSQLAAISSVTRAGGAPQAQSADGPAPLTPLTPDGSAQTSGAGAPAASPLTPLAPLSGPDDAAPLPVSPPPPDRSSATPPAPTPAGEPPPRPPAPAGVYAHLASYRDAREAQDGWAALTAAHKDELGGFSPVIRRTDLGDKGVYHRLYAGPLPDRAAGARLCARLKARNVYCAVLTLAGGPSAASAAGDARAPAPPPISPPSSSRRSAPAAPLSTTPPLADADGGPEAFLGAYADEATARRGLEVFAAAHADVVDPRQLTVRADGAGAWRLTAGPLADAAAAQVFCDRLRARGAFCRVSDPGAPRS